MIYEDLLSLWLAYLLWEFLPSLPLLEGLPITKFLLFSLKEVSFFVGSYLLRKKNCGKFFILLIFFLFSLDLTLFEFKKFLASYYFSVFFILFWFLHYYFWVRILFYGFNLKYLRILFGLYFPFLILILIDELFMFFGLKFSGKFFLLLFGVLALSPLFISKIWPLEKLSPSLLRELILNFLQKEKVKIREVYVIPSLSQKFYTAGILGFIPPFRYLFFSKGLLEILSLDEILGVLAHEVGHLKKRHSLYLFLLILTFPFFLMNALYIFIIPFVLSFKNAENLEIFLKGPYGIVFDFLVALWLFLFAFLFLRGILAYFLRSFEREADSYALESIQRAEPLISALYKIGEFSGQLYKKSWHHYGLLERILYLKRASQDPQLITMHSKKIRKKFLLWILLNMLFIVVFNLIDSHILYRLLKFFIS